MVNINIESVPSNVDCFSVETYDLTDEESLGEQIMALAQNNSVSPTPIIPQMESQKEAEFHSVCAGCDENSAEFTKHRPEETSSTGKQGSVVDTNSNVSPQDDELSTEIQNSTLGAESVGTSTISGFDITHNQENQKDSISEVQSNCPLIENETKSLDFPDDNLPFCQESGSSELHISDKNFFNSLSYSGSSVNKDHEQNRVKGKNFPLDVDEKKRNLICGHNLEGKNFSI